MSSFETRALLDGSINDPGSLKQPKTLIERLKSVAAIFTLIGMLSCWIGELEAGTFMQASCYNTTKVCSSTISTTTGPKFEQNTSTTCHEETTAIPGCATNFFVTYCTRIGWSSVFLFWSFWANCIHTDPEGSKSPMQSAIGKVGWKHLIKWCLPLGVIIFASSYTWYVSFSGTSPDGNSAVYQSAPVFVFLVSIPLLNEKVTTIKVISVLLCCGGVAEIMLIQASGGGKDTIAGYCWLLASVVTYALYEVLF